jgi:small subunit ribosomal protein S3
MGQKIRPEALRVGFVEPWHSRWYADKKTFSKYLVEDFEIRKYIKGRFKSAGVPVIEIERPSDREVSIIIQASRPGVIIGKRGAEIDALKMQLEKKLNTLKTKDERVAVNIQIKEIATAELNGQVAAEQICEQLERRQGFRRLMKNCIRNGLESGALGVKVQISGRIGGVEIARTEKDGEGSVPLQTIRAKISYGQAEAHTTYGRIGVKTWIYLGEYENAR